MRHLVLCIWLLSALTILGCDDADSNMDEQGGDVSLPVLDATRSDVFIVSLDEGVRTDQSTLADDAMLPPDAQLDLPASEDPIIGPNVSDDDVMRLNNAMPTTTCSTVTWRYPENGTIIPARIRGLAFQWVGGTPPYRVTMSAGGQAYQWFVDDTLLSPEGAQWEIVQDLSRGQTPITINVEYLIDSSTRCVSEGLTVQVAEAELKGAVYYWSTTDSGIMRLPLGDEGPELFLGPDLTADPPLNCPACHALSKDGARMAFTNTTFPPFGNMSVIDTETPSQQLYRANEDRNANSMLDPGEDLNGNGELDTVKGYFPSFAPDHRRVVAGAKGKLLIINSDNGQTLEELPIPSEQVAIHPDWSWQGDRIVGLLAAAGLESIFDDLPIPGIEIDISAQGVSDGSLAIWEELDGVWGAPEVLIPPPGGEFNNGRPAFDPSGRWIAYQVSGPDSNPNDDLNSNQSLYITDSTVADPIALTRANGTGEQGNNWPKWSPPTQSRYIWLAFSSLRPYGNITAGGNPQIWITAIDTLAQPGQDPSAPAFWLPGQAPNSGNHIPYWSVYEKL